MKDIDELIEQESTWIAGIENGENYGWYLRRSANNPNGVELRRSDDDLTKRPPDAVCEVEFQTFTGGSRDLAANSVTLGLLRHKHALVGDQAVIFDPGVPGMFSSSFVAAMRGHLGQRLTRLP